MTITDALITEHQVFTIVFDQIERSLPGLTTLAEVQLLARLVEELLQGHAKAESNLAYAALDHVLKDQGKLDRLHQDHHELDASLRRVRAAQNIEEARRLLKTALGASREHFLYEERVVFPLLNRVLHRDTLTALEKARAQTATPVAA